MTEGYTDDDKIVSGSNSYVQTNARQTIMGRKLTRNTTFAGMDIVWEYTAKEDCIVEMPCYLEVVRGKAKLVLISPDDTITTILEVEQTEGEEAVGMNSTASLSLQKGKNRLKLVAVNDTKLLLTMEVAVGKFSD